MTLAQIYYVRQTSVEEKRNEDSSDYGVNPDFVCCMVHTFQSHNKTALPAFMPDEAQQYRSCWSKPFEKLS